MFILWFYVVVVIVVVVIVDIIIIIIVIIIIIIWGYMYVFVHLYVKFSDIKYILCINKNFTQHLFHQLQKMPKRILVYENRAIDTCN